MTTPARAGQMLASAVFYGALLDRFWWGRWLEAAVRGPSIVDDLMWLDLEPLDPNGTGPLSQPRRWFADPLTRMLLGHWHARQAPPIEQNADDCLTAFFNWAGDSCELVDMLMRHAARHWQFRMPKALLAHAEGKHRAVPVSYENWRRVLGCAFNPGNLIAEADDRKPRQYVRRWCSMQMRVLRAAADDIRHRRTDTLSAKKSAADLIGKLKPVLAAERLMNSWCIEALTFDRGKQQRGFMPSTVKSYLSLLTEHVIEQTDDLLKMSADELVDRFDSRLALIEKAGCRTRTLKAVRSLYHHLGRLRSDLPAFPLLLEAHASEQRASANLVSPAEFGRALDLCRNVDQQVCLILGFRCGLRLGEILGLTPHDFFVENDLFELAIIRNEHRNLKTPTSRRILPLNKLLHGAETELVRRHVLERLAALRVAPGNNLLVNRVAAAGGSHAVSSSVKNALDKILSEAASGALTHHHLRHSFASYLLATMLMPDDCDERRVPVGFRGVISAERKASLSDALLGKQKLGQHSLHAVSAMLGHIVPETTTRWYCHLLDLTVMQYVSRPAVEPALPRDQLKILTCRRYEPRRLPFAIHEQSGDTIKRARSYTAPVAASAPLNTLADLVKVSDWCGRRSDQRERSFLIDRQRRIEASDLGPKDFLRLKQPDWRHLAAVLVQLPLAEVEQHFPSLSNPWIEGAARILALRIRTGSPRHELDIAGLLKSRKWASYVDTRWRPDRRLTSIERRALFYAVEHWDGARFQVRFGSRPLAVAWRDLLLSLGFKRAELEITVTGSRFRPRSSEDLHEVLAAGDDLPGTAARRGSRGTIRISFRGDGESNRQVRSAGHFLMLLLAIREGYGAATQS